VSENPETRCNDVAVHHDRKQSFISLSLENEYDSSKPASQEARKTSDIIGVVYMTEFSSNNNSEIVIGRQMIH